MLAKVTDFNDKRFKLVRVKGGLLQYINNGSRVWKEMSSFPKDMFECNICDTYCNLPYRVEHRGSYYWVCSELCGETVILRNM